MSAYMNRAGQDFWPRFRSPSFVEITRARRTCKKILPRRQHGGVQNFSNRFSVDFKACKI